MRHHATLGFLNNDSIFEHWFLRKYPPNQSSLIEHHSALMARKTRVLQFSPHRKNFVSEIQAYLQTIPNISVSCLISSPMLHFVLGGDSKVLLPKVSFSTATISPHII
jgi:hypothetical protein